MKRRTARSGVMICAIANAKVIAGLNNPPEIRKKIQTLTTKDRPNEIEMNKRLDVSIKLPPEGGVILAPGKLAICVPPNARKRNIVVPTNSPTYQFSRIARDGHHGYELLLPLLTAVTQAGVNPLSKSLCSIHAESRITKDLGI